MGVLERPYVAVIGGFRQLTGQAAADAREASRIIGQELAKAGFGLVVYFSNDDSLEPYVVSGYVKHIGEGEDLIRVRYAESQRGHVTFAEEKDRAELFDHRLFPGPDWEAPFYRSLTEDSGVNAVLLLAGGNSTFIAGQIAVARRLPTLAIDGFGGAATRIWNHLAQMSPGGDIGSWGVRSAEVLVKQLKTQCDEAAVRRREALDGERLIRSIASRGLRAAWLSAAFFSLLVTSFFGLVYIPFPPAFPVVMFVGLIAAGATGAIARSLLSDPAEGDPRTSLLLGGLAGFVVGLAYLIPQWVGAPGPLAPKTTNISAIDKIQFASALLIAVSAGVGFDTVFKRLQKEAENVPISPQS